MERLLQPGQELQVTYSTELSSSSNAQSHEVCRVKEFLDAGGQAEVYTVELSKRICVLKWYFREYCAADPQLWPRLDKLLLQGPPNSDFIWPFALAAAPGQRRFGGYLMPYVPRPQFDGLQALREGRVDASFRVLATIRMNLANDLLQLHAKGFCYVDLNLKNVFCDFVTGAVKILDNDNAIPNGDPTPMAGVISSMVPEIVRGESYPTK